MSPQTITQPLILDARTRAGWVSERPWLSEAQSDELLALIGDRLPPGRAQEARTFMSHIFAQAVEDSCLLFRLRRELVQYCRLTGKRTKLTTALSKEANILQSGGMPPTVSDGMRRALTAAQFLQRALPSSAAVVREVDAVIDAAPEAGSLTPELKQLLDDLMITTKTGRDRSVERQMIRGLAALLEYATGECPGRSYVSSERDRSGVGEHGWFHKLCTRFYEFVTAHEMMPPEMRATRPPSLVSVREHIESDESFVIQERRPDSWRSRPCGRSRTAHATTAAACAIRLT